MQKMTIIGNVGADAVVKDINGKKAINFSVAVTKTLKKDGVKTEKTTWFSCAKWVDGNGSVEVAKYLLKGTKVYIEGEPDVQTYVNKENKMAIDFRLIISLLELLGGSKKEGENLISENDKAGAAHEQAQQEQANVVSDDLSF